MKGRIKGELHAVSYIHLKHKSINFARQTQQTDSSVIVNHRGVPFLSIGTSKDFFQSAGALPVCHTLEMTR